MSTLANINSRPFQFCFVLFAIEEFIVANFQVETHSRRQRQRWHRLLMYLLGETRVQIEITFVSHLPLWSNNGVLCLLVETVRSFPFIVWLKKNARLFICFRFCWRSYRPANGTQRKHAWANEAISIYSSVKWRRHAHVCACCSTHTQNKNHLIAERYKCKIISYWSRSLSRCYLSIFCLLVCSLFIRLFFVCCYWWCFGCRCHCRRRRCLGLSFYVALLHDFSFVVGCVCQTAACLGSFVVFAWQFVPFCVCFHFDLLTCVRVTSPGKMSTSHFHFDTRIGLCACAAVIGQNSQQI